MTTTSTVLSAFASDGPDATSSLRDMASSLSESASSRAQEASPTRTSTSSTRSSQAPTLAAGGASDGNSVRMFWALAVVLGLSAGIATII